ncbi:MAG TPA: abortive infection family protein [Planctomycetota bacterium]|nr:abortive infection family protein [Planctomycetota bacterium]
MTTPRPGGGVGASPLVSPRILQAFREHFVRTGVLRTIEDAFTAHGISARSGAADDVNGARRQFVEEFYRSLDLAQIRDARKLLAVFAAELQGIEQTAIDLEEEKRSPPYGVHPRKTLRNFVRLLDREGFAYQDGRITPKHATPLAAELTEHAAALDLPNVVEQLRRLEDVADSDPRLAIGTAKELVETVCKSILRERGVEVDSTWDIPKLVGEVRRELRLLPANVSADAPGKDAIKRVLGSLGSIAHSINELRGLYGTGHGPDGRARGLHGRHARLAVGMASTLATFLLETHREQGPATAEEGRE